MHTATERSRLLLQNTLQVRLLGLFLGLHFRLRLLLLDHFRLQPLYPSFAWKSSTLVYRLHMRLYALTTCF